MPYYHCKHCNFTFKREGEVDCCPDCGKPEVREALQSEVDEFKKNAEQPQRERN